MGIKQTSDGLFKVSFTKRHPITRVPIPLRRKGIKTRAGAEKVFRELVIRVEQKIKASVIPTWECFLNQYFEIIGKSGLTNTTVYNREKTLRHYTIPAWSDRTLDAVTRDDVMEVLNVKMSGLSESHRKFFLKCVRSVFAEALDRQLIGRSPVPLIKFKASDKIGAVLTEPQIIKLLAKAQELDWEWYPHYAVALYTGMRNGELYALTWSKVNLEDRTILVNTSWSSKDGYKSTKSGDDRIIEIPKPLLPVLQELKLANQVNDYVLPRLQKWDKGDQARDLRLFLKSIGLPEVKFHDLRASWATLLLSKGVAPSKVMSMGGWKDLKTMLIYMRKAGIDIKGSTSVLDHLSTHGKPEGTVLTFGTM